MQTPHIPVLLQAVLEHLDCQGGIFVDGTFGAGGYTRAILQAHPNNRVIAFDRDPNTHDTAQKFRQEYGERFTFIPDRFSRVAEYVREPVDGFVLDIGVSSMQIDQPERGFSFRFDGPLDMRMSGNGLSAAEVVNTFSEKQLADILYEFGQEKQSRKIAHAIVLNRPIDTTQKLAETIHHVMPKPRDNSDSAMRSFQALRIYVNDELGELKQALEASKSILKKGGRLVVVDFHSLEDRIVKDFFRQNATSRKHLNKYAVSTSTETGAFIVSQKSVVVADDDELARNPRAHSAKLRWAVRR